MAKNPVMVLAGKKAAITRKKNKQKLAEKRSLAGVRAHLTRRANKVALPISFGKIAVIKKEDLPTEMIDRFDKFVTSIKEDERFYEISEELFFELEAGVDPATDSITDEPLGDVSYAIFLKTKGCSHLQII